MADLITRRGLIRDLIAPVLFTLAIAGGLWMVPFAGLALCVCRRSTEVRG